MAIDNLNVMTSGLPAGQQTDKYSTKPGCLRSKNLDIFSSSKSAKGTAWSEGTSGDSDIVATSGNLVLKTDGKVYQNGTVIVNPAQNFPVHDVSYTGRYGVYTPAEYGTPKDLVSQSSSRGLETFTVFTNKSSYTYNRNGFIFDKTYGDVRNLVPLHKGERWRMSYSGGGIREGYMFQKQDNNAQYAEISININTSQLGTFRLGFSAYDWESSSIDALPYFDYYQIRGVEYYYDQQTDSFVALRNSHSTVQGDHDRDLYTDPYYLELPALPRQATTLYYMTLYFRRKKNEGANTYKRNDVIMVDFMGGPDKDWSVEKMAWVNNIDVYEDCAEVYSYLPVKNQRKLKKIGEYRWEKGDTTQTLYKYDESWVMNPDGKHVVNYELKKDMAWDNSPNMDVVDMISWNEKIYMIGNMDGNGYIIPCDLTGGKGTPYIAYGCTFKGAVNIDYLLYLVGEDRGVSQLRVFNGQELCPLIGGNKKKELSLGFEIPDVVDTDEQYRFNGMMVEYRGNLVLATEDNRLFEYGQTYGGKGGAFILDVPGDSIKGLKVQGDDLIVEYEVITEVEGNNVFTTYSMVYQDDVANRRYLNREAEYPIAIGNHLLEKEESDLYVSYKIPNKDCKLRFRGNANHYTYWTFKVGDPMPGISRNNALTMLRTRKLEILGSGGDYKLEYVEDDGERFTYRLNGELPPQTENSRMILALYKQNHNDDGIMTYTEYNHFRYIGEITADGFVEGEYRFHNLNNKLDLPKSHTLQIKVEGISDSNGKGTPELFVLDLVANQRSRG